jgi:hypothetical protein
MVCVGVDNIFFLKALKYRNKCDQLSIVLLSQLLHYLNITHLSFDMSHEKYSRSCVRTKCYLLSMHFVTRNVTISLPLCGNCSFCMKKQALCIYKHIDQNLHKPDATNRSGHAIFNFQKYTQNFARK